ncbi:MAG: hypothetical protein AAFR17_07670 [Pseudomonadota bacterium]
MGVAGRVIGVLGALLIAAALFYLSRYWFLTDLWPREGLFGLDWLTPRGGLVGTWLRGTPWAPFELLAWAIGSFLFLSLLIGIGGWIRK